jgi:hypothetical protein
MIFRGRTFYGTRLMENAGHISKKDDADMIAVMGTT